jgi:hypothetical protein
VFVRRLLGEGYAAQGDLFEAYGDLKALKEGVNCNISASHTLSDVSAVYVITSTCPI